MSYIMTPEGWRHVNPAFTATLATRRGQHAVLVAARAEVAIAIRTPLPPSATQQQYGAKMERIAALFRPIAAQSDRLLGITPYVEHWPATVRWPEPINATLRG